MSKESAKHAAEQLAHDKRDERAEEKREDLAQDKQDQEREQRADDKREHEQQLANEQLEQAPAKPKDAPVAKEKATQSPAIRDWPESPEAPHASRVDVAKGDFIVHVVGIGGREPHRGGWFKADSAVRVSAKVNILAVALEPFGYDPEEGALYHTVKNRPYKVFYTDPDKPQVVNAKIHEKVGDRRLNRVDLD